MAISGKVQLIIPPAKTVVQFENTRYEIPFPALLFFYSIQKGRVINTEIYALKGGQWNEKSVLYNYPYGNVNPCSHSVCWGTNVLPEVTDLQKLDVVCSMFYTSPCNNDLYMAGKSTVWKIENLRNVFEQLKKRQDFPDEILVNSGRGTVGIDEKELQGLEKKPAAKKEKKKKEKKTAAKYKLPIQFCGGHLRRVFTDVNETAWSEEKLKSEIRRTFRELAGLYFKLHVLDVKEGSEEIGTYVKPEILYSAFTQDEKLDFPLEVVAGEKTLWADTKLSLDEIRRLWIQEHPEYEGCKFQYDEKQKLLIPFMDQSAPRGKAYTLPVTVGYLDIRETYQAEDFETAEVTMEALREKYSEKYPEFSISGGDESFISGSGKRRRERKHEHFNSGRAQGGRILYPGTAGGCPWPELGNAGRDPGGVGSNLSGIFQGAHGDAL